ncbi:lipopolysaccharide biosynthesis protein [Humisphaera borealis]|uniref:Uncharacterized protein n=1 Tax=Humisphaera borealis TaxID=2807512 RepID=A0A7M2X0R3_9BACT|nr:hypothetical protein [Humisphaera borealis]QOV91275.1 hypothetical protein IPV69_07930 [Humisphaera borealis]
MEVTTVENQPVAGLTPEETSLWRFRGAIKVGSAIVEQGTFSLSTWLLQTFMVRWLADEADFGGFSIAFAWFLLAGAAHNALVIEPMMVYGGKRYAGQIRQYFGVLAGGSVCASVSMAVLLAGVGLGYATFGHPGVAAACWSLAGAAPFVFLLWLMRRTSYVTHRPHRSAIAGAGYLFAMVAGFVLLHQAGRFTVPMAVLVMAVASLGASIWLLRSEAVVWPAGANDSQTSQSLAISVRNDHWRFGRWMLLSGLAGMIASQWFFVVLPWFTDVGAGGALRALSNLFQPVVQAIIAFTGVLLPVLVRAVGTPRYVALVRKAMLVMVGGPLLAWLACGLLSSWLVRLVYSGRYLDDAPLLWLLGLQPAAAGFIAVVHAELCVADRPDRMFAASAASLAFTLTAGTALMYFGGMWGVTAATLGAMLLNALVAWYFVRTGPRLSSGAGHPDDGSRGETGI